MWAETSGHYLNLMGAFRIHGALKPGGVRSNLTLSNR
jgi:hypothetical protein